MNDVNPKSSKNGNGLLTKFARSGNKTSIILSLIFLCLVVYGVFVMLDMYMSKMHIESKFLEVSGRIEGYEYHAGTRVAGKVLDVYIEEGQHVKVGDKIALIQSKQRRALLEHGQAQLRKAKADLELAKIEHDRYTRLFEQKAIAKMEYDRIQTRYESAQAKVSAMQDQIDKLSADLEDTVVLAPISGTVVTKVVRAGEVVPVGTPIVTLINLDELFLKIFLATDVAGKVNLGDEAIVIPDAMPKRRFDAFVYRIAQKAEFTPKNVETKSQRAKLVFEIKLKVKDNIDHDLKPGMPSSGVIKISKNASWKSYKRA